MAASRKPETRNFSYPIKRMGELSSDQPSSSFGESSARAADKRGGSPGRHQAVGPSHDDGNLNNSYRDSFPNVGRLSKGITGKTESKPLIDQTSVKPPVLAQMPARRIRPSTKQISAPIPLRPAEGPSSSSAYEAPIIDPKNLGVPWEALGSHPIKESLSSRSNIQDGQDTKAQDIETQDTKAKRRKYIVCEKDADDSIVLINREPPVATVDRIAERRKGRVFSTKNWQKQLEELSHSASEETNEAGQGAKAPFEGTIPTIELSPPSDDGNPQYVNPGLLSVDDTFKILYRSGKKENRSLKKHLHRLQPLAWLVSEAEGIDINNTAALAEALRDIIEDRQMLMSILPLAVTLCEDQGIDFNSKAFEALPQALDEVLNERDRAKYAVSHHQRVRQLLENRYLLSASPPMHVRPMLGPLGARKPTLTLPNIYPTISYPVASHIQTDSAAGGAGSLNNLIYFLPSKQDPPLPDRHIDCQ
ncbi:hypothetical protein GGR50DRAFT_55669 [Xylaria sp. CBS 124048]|nr:hypothetical protein GGR50DRAFT_55669 [Xylaria sp. CBS 124048]